MAGIYGLYDPRVPAHVRYIGQTVQTLRRRLQGHLRGAATSKSQCHTLQWMRKLVCEGTAPAITMVHECSPAELDHLEIVYEGEFRASGHDLTNTAPAGGKPPVGMMKGRKMSDETKAKISATKKGVRLSTEHRQKIGEALVGRICVWKGKSSPMKGRKMTDEQRAHIAMKTKVAMQKVDKDLLSAAGKKGAENRWRDAA